MTFKIKKYFNIFSVEFIFALYLLSGDIKGIFFMEQIRNIPDLTLVTAIILSIMLLFNHKDLQDISAESYMSISILFLLFLAMIFSLTYTSSSTYAIKKTIYFSLVLLSILIPIAANKFDVNKFMLTFSLIVFPITLIYLKFLFAYVNGTLTTNLSPDEVILARGMYLGLSLANGIIALYYFFNRSSHRFRLLFVTIGLLLMILAGGRGALLFAFFIFFFYALLRLLWLLKTLKLKMGALIGIIVFVAILFVLSMNHTELIDRTIRRFGLLIGGESAHARFEYLTFALDRINHAPIFGYGVGSFGLEYTGIDKKEYPHNLFVEIWFELGLLPLILFIVFSLIVLHSIIKSKCYWCLAIYVYLFLDTLKASSLSGIRLLIGFLGIFLMVQTIREEPKIENP